MSINFNHVTNDISASAGSVTIDGSPAGGGLTLGTPVATTSGTSIDFTGIPSGTKQVVISFSGVSTNGASNFLIQIGDAGGIENTGYTADAIRIDATVTTIDTSSAGFLVINSHTAYLRSGRIVLSLLNATTFTWVASGVSNQHGSAVGSTSGVKALSAEFDRVRLTTVNGTDTFDAGEINIAYI